MPLRPSIVLAALALSAALGAVGTACDPVHDDALAALGDEAPGVPKGPLHRPGQPCGLCHDGAIGSPPAFTLAGTVYRSEDDLVPPNGTVTIAFVDHAHKTFEATTNEVGNFYVRPSEFTPSYPVQVTLKAGRSISIPMHSLVGRDGSCADCHKDPVGPTSPGHVFIYESDGGTVP